MKDNTRITYDGDVEQFGAFQHLLQNALLLRQIQYHLMILFQHQWWYELEAEV